MKGWKLHEKISKHFVSLPGDGHPDKSFQATSISYSCRERKGAEVRKSGGYWGLSAIDSIYGEPRPHNPGQ